VTRPPAERRAALAAGCGDDEALRADVEALLIPAFLRARADLRRQETWQRGVK
jgi:hypothetical protein